MPWIFQFRFYFFCYIMNQDLCFVVIDLIWFNHYTNFTPCLNRISLFNTFKPICNSLKVLKSLNIVFNRLSPSPRSSTRDSIGSLYNDCLECPWLDIVMVRFYASTSWSTAFPKSCNSPPRLATFSLAPISAANMPAIYETSSEWLSTFCP